MAEQRVEIDGRRFAVSNLDKVLFPDDGITKAELIQHAVRHGDDLLRHAWDRPLSLVRAPDGLAGGRFFQKHPTAAYPDWIPRVALVRTEAPPGGEPASRRRAEAADDEPKEYVVARDRATLAFLANLGAIELHVMQAPAAAPDRPDELVLDLDPPKGAEIAQVRRVAHLALALLDELEVPVRIKASGSTGYHLHVALAGSVDGASAAAMSQGLALELARRHPGECTDALRIARRRGRVFVDWLRNRPGQTSIAAYSPRLRPGAPVAAPIARDELDELAPDALTIRTIGGRLERDGDPWSAPAQPLSAERVRAVTDELPAPASS